MHIVSRKTLESLILAGAMDSLHENRKQMFDSIEMAIQYGQNAQEVKMLGQESLFGSSATSKKEVNIIPSLPNVAQDWGFSERLSKEKSVLGFYLSAHPLDSYRTEIEAYNNIHLASPDELQSVDNIRLFGIVTDLRTKIDKKGNTMAFFTIEDFTGKGECIIFSDAFSKYNKLINIDDIIGVTGKGESAGDKIRIIVETVNPINKINYDRHISIDIIPELLKQDDILNAKNIIENYPGNCQLLFKVVDNSTLGNKVYKAKKFLVNPNNKLLQELKSIFGEEQVKISNNWHYNKVNL